jgi:uncharacterized damage-inducible protein DinB
LNAELDRIEGSWRPLMELVDGMDDATLAAPGPDGWAIKDHLFHLAAWELSLLALVEGKDRQAAMGVTLDPEAETDPINDAVFQLHRRESVEAARKYLGDSHSRLVAALAELTDADLQRPYSFYQPGDVVEMRPVIGWVGGNTYEHYDEHAGWIKEHPATRS